MRRTTRLCVAGALVASLATALPAGADSHLETVLTGVDNGRGLTFDAAGTLYVAASGIGDAAFTSEDYDTDAAMCVTGPEGHPACYGETGQVLRVADAGSVTGAPAADHVLIDAIPSHAGLAGAEGIGAADVSIGPDGMLYYIVGLGADPAARDALTADGAPRADEFATLRVADPADGAGDAEVADLGAHEATNDPDGQGADSNPFGLVAEAARVTVADSGANAILEVALPGGAITTGAVLPPVVVPAPPFLGAPSGTNIPAQAVPTGISAMSGGGYAIGQLTGFPFSPGSAGIWSFDGSDATPWYAGFTNVMDVAEGPDGALYVLELAHDGLLNAEGLPIGALIRVTASGGSVTRELLADDLPMPGGMAFDPTEAGMLYMTTFSAGPDGEVVRFDTSTAAPILTVVDDAAATDEDQRLTVDVAANDDGVATVTPLDIARGAVTGPDVTYQPPVHVAGTDQVVYRGCDADGHCLNGVLTVTIRETATDRIAGATRLLTAVEASLAHFPDGAPAVLIARADLYPDALAGGPLAAAVGGPILLTSSDRLDDDVAAEIARLRPGTAYVLGGTAALSAAVEDAVGDLVGDTQRLEGADRFQTAVAIMEAIEGATGDPAVKAFVVEGRDADPARGWPDAVAISAQASAIRAPILLVETDVLPGATAAALDGLGQATIVGGQVAVGAAVRAAIGDLVDDVSEIAGSTRFATSQMIAQSQVTNGGAANVVVVSGGNWPDALVAGPLAGMQGDALILVHPTDLAGSPETVTFLEDNTFGDVDLYGGRAAISLAVERGIAAATD